MPSLRSLQEALQNHVLLDIDGVADQLVKPARGILDDRLAVYAYGYRRRLIDALQQGYPLLYEHLGEDAFEAFSEAYIDKYPSRYYSINEFTRQLPEFLAAYQSEQAYLGELALIIRALSLSLDSVDASLLDYRALTEVPIQNWPELCFKYHPSVQCLILQWNTFSLWKALVQKTALPRMDKAVSYCMIWRKESQSYANNLTPLELAVFQAFQAGYCFADVCTTVHASGLSREAEAARWLADYLMRGLNDHLFSEVYIP